MPSYRRLIAKEPLGIFAVLWPVVFLAPLVPGLPKVWLTSLPWRQELVVAFLLLITFGLLLRLTWNKSKHSSNISLSECAIFLSLTFFILWGCISLSWTQGWLNTIHYCFTWTIYLLCFILMRRIAQRPRLLRLSIASLAVALLIISVASAIEFLSSSPDLYQYALILRRSTGLGEPLAVSIPLFALLSITLHNKRAALLCGATTILASLATLQTLERTPLFALGAGLLLILAGLVVKPTWRPTRPRRVVILVAMLLIMAGLQTFLPTGSSSSLQRVQNLDATDPTAQVRLLVWAVGLEMLRAHPVRGVGAGNYELAYPEARGQFSAKHPESKLVNQQEELLAQRAHNEYVQILAELGAVGFALFLMFCGGLIWMAVRALRNARSPLALGALGSLTTFAVSSGASSVSFRWLGSGLLFFFAASIIVQFASLPKNKDAVITFHPLFTRATTTASFAVVLTILCGAGVLGVNSALRAMALDQAANSSPNPDADTDPSEPYFRAALRWNPVDAPTHFDFGGWLYGKRRYQEAAQHLGFATEHGFNSSTCYAFLAGALSAASDTAAAEKTLAHAVSVYPQSVFLRVRHSIALAEAGRSTEAAKEYELAVALDASGARGWRQLMCFGPDTAYAAAQTDKGISPPKNLMPQSWAYPAIAEHARRPPFAYPPEIGSGGAN